MKILSLLFRIALCFVVTIYAIKGLGSETPSYLRENMYQWFTGTWEDWSGLILFNLLMLGMGVWNMAKNADVSEEVGSVGKSILIGFVVPVVSLLLIYIR